MSPRASAAGGRASTLVFLLAVCATAQLESQCPDGTPPPCAVRPFHAAAPAPNSVAVIYLDNESRDSSDAYLADGLTEEITTKLGQIGRLLPGEQASLAARPTQNPEAYDHFLRGNFLMTQRAPTPARRAVAEYQAAVALDPAFARALGRMGLAYALFLDWGWPFPGLGYGSLLALGAAAADRALELDSESTDAWLARAYTQVYLNPTTFGGALAAFNRAITLDPKNAEAHHQYGGILMTMGRDSAGAEEFRRALAFDPARAITLDNLADLRYFERRPIEALRFADSGIAVDPQAYYLYVDRANIRLTAGDAAGARADAEAAARTHPADYVISSEALSATLQAYAGDTAGARARLERAAQQLADPAHPDYSQAQWLALAWLRIGDRQRALAVLEAVRPRGIDLWYIMRDPGFDPIRQEARFRALVEQTRPAPSR